MKSARIFFILVSLLLSSTLLVSCSGGGASPSGTTGTITGKVLDDNGTPLKNIRPEDVLVVTLFCFEDNPAVECFQEDFWDIDLKLLLSSICAEDEERDDCLVHLGNYAAEVESNGSFTIENVPPGNYGLVLIYQGYSLMGTSLKRELDPVLAGKVTKGDIETNLTVK